MAYNEGPSSGTQTRLTKAIISQKFQSLVAKIPKLAKHRDSERISVLWNEVGSRDEILRLIADDVDDLWLPIPGDLPLRWLDPSKFRRFKPKQPSFLSGAFVVNESEQPGEHMNLDNCAVNFKHIPHTLDHQQEIGAGGFGEVDAVKYKANNRVYALKRILRKTEFKEAQEQMRYVQIELAVLRRIHHDHYVRLVGSYTELKYIGILMDPVADCNLGQYLDEFERDQGNEILLASFFGCLVGALLHLHYYWNIRHKDIKPENILVQKWRKNILFTDFGMSLDWSSSGKSTTRQERLRSSAYCAPEVANEEDRNSKSDVWSLGCVFLEMAVVLKGKPRSYIREALKTKMPVVYWRCQTGIQEVVSSLLEDGSRWGDEPLSWSKEMLRDRKEDRPRLQGLKEKILEARGFRNLSFCGTCCKADTLVREENGGEDKGEDLGEDFNDMMASITLEQGGMTMNAEGTALPKASSAMLHNPIDCIWGAVQLLYHAQPGNWISADTAAKYHLADEVIKEDVAEIEVADFGPRRLKSIKLVKAEWAFDPFSNPDKKSRDSVFSVAEEGLPPDVLLLGQ